MDARHGKSVPYVISDEVAKTYETLLADVQVKAALQFTEWDHQTTIEDQIRITRDSSAPFYGRDAQALLPGLFGGTGVTRCDH